MTNHFWHYEVVYARWPEAQFAEVLESATRNTWINQSIGPVTLLFGAEL